MKGIQKMNRIKDTFREGSQFRVFLLSLLITGLSYGLYKGMLDNFLAEVVGMGEMDRGIMEFFRELPGIMLVFILAVFYMLSAESLYKAGALIMLVGMGMNALLPATKVLATLAICMYSLGEHIQLGMKNTLSLKYAKPGRGGAALGAQSAMSQIGTLVGYLVIVGRIIDKLGYKVVMVADTLILVIVCFFYGFAHHIFPKDVAFIVCCVNYILDSIISLASMASNIYVQDLADNEEEVKATISTGVSINHVITVFIALFGGWIWQTLGIELLFIASAVLGLCNSAYAATIKTKKQEGFT